MKQKTFLFLAMAAFSTLACSLFSSSIQPDVGEIPTSASQTNDSVPVSTDAPSPVEAVAPNGDSCLIGTWTVTGFEQYMSSVLPSEIQSMGELSYNGMSGVASYTFNIDNMTSIQAEMFTVSYLINVAGISMSLDVIVDGSGSATYTIEGDQILFTDIEANTLFMTIKLNGIEAGPAEPLPGIFPGGDTNSTVTYQCDVNTLYMTMPVENSEPVILGRSSP